MVGSAKLPPYHFLSPGGFNPIHGAGLLPRHVIATAASLRIAHLLTRPPPAFFNELREKASKFQGINISDLLKDSLSAASSSYKVLFGGNGNRCSYLCKWELVKSRKVPFGGRGWTNTLLIVNVLVFIAQFATKGKLFRIGAKIDRFIDQGQLWRLATSSLLHVNIGHLMVNCFSLNAIGPAVERTSGPRRFLAVYFTSAIACSAMSYWLTKSPAPAVGASGALFGLVGYLAVFLSRHRGLVKSGNEDLRNITLMIVLNMAVGLVFKRVDNWGHVGGLLGGAATSWLLGPSWEYQFLLNDRHKVFFDKAPIFSLVNPKFTPYMIK